MTHPEDDGIAPPTRGDDRLPQTEDSTDVESDERSLLGDLQALIEDGKTYLEAEVGYQKTRAAYVADRAKAAVVFGAISVLLGFLALIGITVGLIIALTPLLTAWGASLLVVMLLALGAALAGSAAKRRWDRLMAVIDTKPGAEP